MIRARNHAASLAVIALLLAVFVSGEAHASTDAGFDDYLQRGWLWVHIAAFGFGFLTSLTPCVYPMIPIVVGIFGAREATTRGRGFSIGLAYVLGMGLMFSSLGVVFAIVGQQANQLLGNPWVVFPMVGIYAALAASMFGAFELRLPHSVQNRLAMVGGKGYGGAAAMGMVGGLTAAPCTGPFLVGLIGVIAATGNLVAGFTVMFAYALGIGVLFLFLAAFAVSLPKSGPWMEWVKSAGGIALLVVGLFFLRPVLPAVREFTSTHPMFLWGMLAVAAAGIGLGAVHLSFRDGWPRKLRKGAGIAIAVVGFTGALNAVLTPSRELPWHYDEAEAFAHAAETDRGVMVDFYATWCLPCIELERIFARPGVYERIVDEFVPLKFDVSQASDEDFALQDRFDAHTLPAVIFFDAEGNELGRITTTSPSTAGVLEALDALPPRGLDGAPDAADAADDAAARASR